MKVDFVNFGRSAFLTRSGRVRVTQGARREDIAALGVAG